MEHCALWDSTALRTGFPMSTKRVTTLRPVRRPGDGLINRIESYLKSYTVLPEPSYALPLALWTAMTHAWPDAFASVPYIAITAATAGAGKTMVADLLSFVSARSEMCSKATLASARDLAAARATLFFDEFEASQSEHGDFREFLNSGYRSGGFMWANRRGQPTKTSTFGPKCFQLIGDPCVTLRDRCIAIEMRRPSEQEREQKVAKYNRLIAEPRGNALRDELIRVIESRMPEISGLYLQSIKMPRFEIPRDREIWEPLFVLCHILCPDRLRELSRAAVDMAAAKTAPQRKAKELAAAEEEERDRHYAERLLIDMASVVGEGRMYTKDIITALRDLETSPWRTYKGCGIQPGKEGAMLISSLLSRFGVRPKNWRIGKKLAKGYSGPHLKAAMEKAGVRPDEPMAVSEAEADLEEFMTVREA